MSIESEIQGLIDQAIQEEREEIDAEIWELVQRIRALEAGQRPPPPPPPPLPPPLPARIEDDRLIFQLDPYRPETYGLSRPFGQIEAAANTINVGSPFDIVALQLPPELRGGYGLHQDQWGDVHSWEMEDGTALRYGSLTVEDRRWFRLATQSRPHLDGYDPAGNTWWRNGERVDPGQGWRINTVLDRRDRHSDACTFDGHKSGISGIGANLATGPGATPVVWGFAVRGKRWFQTSAHISALVDLHNPGWNTTGQLVAHIHEGELIFGSKSSPTADALAWSTTNNTRLVDVELGRVDLPEEGEERHYVVVARPDRRGGSHLFRVYEGDGDGRMDAATSFHEPYGLTWSQPQKNRENYPKVQVYQWKEHNPPGSGRLPTWNHDERYGNVYDLECLVAVTTWERAGWASVSEAVVDMGHHLSAVARGR